MKSLKMNKDTAIRVYKYIIGATWPLGIISTFCLVKIITSLWGACASGYDYGDHPVDGWDFTSPTWTTLGMGIVVSLLFACFGILVIAIFLSLFQNLPIRYAFKKVYRILLLATWPIIFIISLITTSLLLATWLVILIVSFIIISLVLVLVYSRVIS